MPSLELKTLLPDLVELERARDSRVLVFAATTIAADLLPALYERCLQIGHVRRLDVLLHSRGGDVQAARRIGLLLREHCDHLAFIVPYHCASAATLLTLCADEIVAGSLALFSPIDPILSGIEGMACSILDIQRLDDVARHWFGVSPDQAGAQAWALLCNGIAPPALAAFYRASQLMTQVAGELLAFQLPDLDAVERGRIVDQLMSAYHSHSDTITGEQLKALGLRVSSHPHPLRHAWAISRALQTTIGPRCRDDEAMPWKDCMLATREVIAIRQRHSNDANPHWSVEKAA